METEQHSQQINTASPLPVLRSCFPKLEVLLQISAMTHKLEPLPYRQGEPDRNHQIHSREHHQHFLLRDKVPVSLKQLCKVMLRWKVLAETAQLTVS